MDKDYCYICGEELTKSNESEEHIIPNAIGGKLKSNKLICKDCNNKIGYNSDSKLAEQLNMITNLLNINRDRNNNSIPDIEGLIINDSNNSEVKITSSGFINIVTKEDKKADSNKSFIVRSKKEALRLLKDFKKKKDDIDITSSLNSMENHKVISPIIKMELNFGGKDIYTSIYKIIFNMYIHNGFNKKYIKKLVDKIMVEKNIENSSSNYVQLYSTSRRISIQDDNEVSHIIYLNGNKEHKILFGYIELYNILSFLVLLDNNYEGDCIEYSYCYDVLSKKEKNITCNIPLNYEEIKKYKYDGNYFYNKNAIYISLIMRAESILNNKNEDIDDKLIAFSNLINYKREYFGYEEFIKDNKYINLEDNMSILYKCLICIEKKEYYDAKKLLFYYINIGKNINPYIYHLLSDVYIHLKNDKLSEKFKSLYKKLDEQ